MVVSLMEEKSSNTTTKRQSDQLESSHPNSPLHVKRDKRQQVNQTSTRTQASPYDNADAPASPSKHTDHKEMDLADDSLSFEGELADLSMIEDSPPPNHHQND